MTKNKNKVVAFFLLIVMTITMLFGGLALHADYTEGGSPVDTLKNTVRTGKYTYIKSGKIYDFTTTRYKTSGGGYWLYTELFGTSTNLKNDSGRGDLFHSDKFDELKPAAKQRFLNDVFTIANAVVADTNAGYHTGQVAPTEDTMSDFMQLVQDQSGMGSAMLATLMQNTKPDYAAANRIYEPFSGTVGTILGIISILVMALLGVTMALDIAYITIPAFQMAMNGGEDTSGNGSKSKGIGGIISQEAKKAVQAADGGSGGQGGSGEYKAAVGIYFKYRWKGLVMLGICLLYLVQGQIYSFVGWFIDLFSGFLGF